MIKEYSAHTAHLLAMRNREVRVARGFMFVEIFAVTGTNLSEAPVKADDLSNLWIVRRQVNAAPKPPRDPLAVRCSLVWNCDLKVTHVHVDGGHVRVERM